MPVVGGSCEVWDYEGRARGGQDGTGDNLFLCVDEIRVRGVMPFVSVNKKATSQSNIRLLRTLSPLYRLWEAAHNTALPPRNWRGAGSSLVRALRGFAVRIPSSFNACLNYFKLDWWCRPPPGKSRARYGRIAEIMAASLYEATI